MNKLVVLFSAVLTLLLSSCDGGRIIDEYVEVPGKSWTQKDRFSFRFDIDDTESSYDILLKLRHNNDYSFSNIYFFVEVAAPDGVIQRDTVQYLLAQPDGKWLGDGIGALKTNLFLYGDQVHFPKEGSYRIDIVQGMREEELEGLEDIGIRVAKVDN